MEPKSRAPQKGASSTHGGFVGSMLICIVSASSVWFPLFGAHGDFGGLGSTNRCGQHVLIWWSIWEGHGRLTKLQPQKLDSLNLPCPLRETGNWSDWTPGPPFAQIRPGTCSQLPSTSDEGHLFGVSCFGNLFVALEHGLSCPL